MADADYIPSTIGDTAAPDATGEGAEASPVAPSPPFP